MFYPNKTVLYLIVLLVFPLDALVAQEVDTTKINSHISLAEKLASETKNNLSATEYGLAAELYKTAGDWENYVDISIKQAVRFRAADDFVSSNEKLKELAAISEKKIGKFHPHTGSVYHQWGVLSYVESDYDQAIERYKEAIKIRERALGNNHPDLSNSYHNLGVAYRYRGHFSNAIEPLETAIRMRDAQGTQKKLADSYHQLGIISESLGDFERSLEYTELALDLYNDVLPENQYWYVARCYRDRGIVYRKMDDGHRSLKEFNLAMEIYTALYGENEIAVAYILTNMSNSHILNGNYNRAVEACERSLKILDRIKSNDKRAYVWNYNNLGRSYMHLNQIDTARSWLQKAIDAGHEEYGNFHPELGKSYDNLGDIALKNGEITVALGQYQMAIINSFADFRETDFYKNPNLSSNDITAAKTDLLNYLSSKGNALRALHTNSNDVQDLRQSYETNQLVDRLIEIILRDFREEGSTINLVSRAIPFYESAIGTSLKMFDETGEENYRDQAFQFAEKSKAVVLLGSLKNLKAANFGGIPESVLLKEGELKQDVAFYEQKLENSLLQNLSDSVILASRNEVLDKKNAYESLIRELEQTYPEYYNLKYSNTTSDLTSIRKSLLDSNSVILEYFIGDSSNYLFEVSLEEFNIHRLQDFSSISTSIFKLLDLVKNPISEQIKSDHFISLSAAIFKSIIPDGLTEKYNRMIVIPDGALSYLPFGMLLCDEPETSVNYKQLPFLIRFAAVGYAYSVVTLMESSGTHIKGTKDKVLAMAPVFENSKNFNPLVHSRNELKFLEKELDTKVYKNEEATRIRFLSDAHKYDIIHLSTHASVGDSSNINSWIAFDDSGSNIESDFKLYLKDLYTMKLKAAMVVLSACETARGKMQKGEGVMSLARGFAYAGCQSIITTLWEVNNQSTADIMELFYTHLGTGLTKDVALQRAKMTYLDRDAVDQFSAQPYFWAAYIPVGDLQALQLKFNIRDYLSLMLVLLGVLIITGFAIIRKTKG